jgi:hypothetical protein
VGDDDLVADPIAELVRHLGAEHGVVQIVEAFSLRDHQRRSRA